MDDEADVCAASSAVCNSLTCDDRTVLNGTIEPDQSDIALPTLANPQSEDAFSSKEDAVERLRTLIEERRGETVEVLRNWLDEPQAEDAR